MNIQPLLNIAEICVQKGINHVVISPGSRSAPITLGFANHPKITCKVINDERSAAFIALGMALSLNQSVALVCTSGTASLNYAPAIAEAYYQQIPLLVLTADRPPELINQQDGQCLNQSEIYKNYIKSSFQTPDTLVSELEKKEFYDTVNKAINSVELSPKGPVHINIPIREPFYPEPKVEYKLNNIVLENIELKSQNLNFQHLIERINSSKKVLFIAGQQRPNELLQKYIRQLVDNKYPVIADINSNLSNIENVIQEEDFIYQSKTIDLDHELVVTFGNSILSKSLKTYFRKNEIEHYHIAETNPVPDFFSQIKDSFQCSPTYFFNNIIDLINKGDENYFETWNVKSLDIKKNKITFLSTCDYSELYITNKILNLLPSKSHLHLANSMAVRWVNMIGLAGVKNFKVQSNRGVSGIDGSTSTALGYSICSDKSNFLITGDISFFYDRNAFWNNYIPNNLKIILLNNHEGGIFNMIPGPSKNKEMLKYFTSTQNLTAKSLSNEFELDYFFVDESVNFDNEFNAFLSSNKCSVIEFKTESGINKNVFDSLKNIF